MLLFHNVYLIRIYLIAINESMDRASSSRRINPLAKQLIRDIKNFDGLVHRNYDEDMRRGIGIRRNYGDSKAF
jgi:hypothetical protein